VQLRLECKLTAEEYIAQRFWESASLPPCPKHPKGKCGFARHTAYERKSLAGAFIARGYCWLGHFTVSLLPDFLASRLPSTLAEVEREVALVERSDGSIAATAARQHPTVGETDRVQGAERRLRRRSKGVRAALVTLVGLMPEVFAGHPPTLEGFREALAPGLGLAPVLVALRGRAAPHLAHLPPPLGFGPRPFLRRAAAPRVQQGAGPAPPVPST
jgi:hypothetical protein